MIAGETEQLWQREAGDYDEFFWKKKKKSPEEKAKKEKKRRRFWEQLSDAHKVIRAVTEAKLGVQPPVDKPSDLEFKLDKGTDSGTSAGDKDKKNYTPFYIIGTVAGIGLIILVVVKLKKAKN